MTILVTGGAGFIGSALVRLLKAETDCRVVNVDKLTYAANPASLAAAADSPRYRLEQFDIRDERRLNSLFERERPDAVVHLAAESHVDRSIDGPADFMQTNLLGTFTLLEAARRYLPRAPDGFRLLHVSTDEVYGDLPDDGIPWRENAPYHPSSPYAATKAGADHLVRAWGRTYGLPVLISHCSNNYGPRQFPEKLIPNCILRALAGETLPVYGDGGQVRDWLFVEDHAAALWRILQDGRTGETYHISASHELRNLDVVHAVCDTLETLRPSREPYRTQISFVADRPGHDRRYALDPSKLEHELGWRAATGFEDGLERTVRWYLDHEAWWQPLAQGGSAQQRRGLGEAAP